MPHSCSVEIKIEVCLRPIILFKTANNKRKSRFIRHKASMWPSMSHKNRQNVEKNRPDKSVLNEGRCKTLKTLTKKKKSPNDNLILVKLHHILNTICSLQNCRDGKSWLQSLEHKLRGPGCEIALRCLYESIKCRLIPLRDNRPLWNVAHGGLQKHKMCNLLLKSDTNKATNCLVKTRQADKIFLPIRNHRSVIPRGGGGTGGTAFLHGSSHRPRHQCSPARLSLSPVASGWKIAKLCVAFPYRPCHVCNFNFC